VAAWRRHRVRIRLSAEADPRWHGMWAVQTHAGRFVGASTITRTTNSNGDLDLPRFCRTPGLSCHASCSRRRSNARGLR